MPQTWKRSMRIGAFVASVGLLVGGVVGGVLGAHSEQFDAPLPAVVQGTLHGVLVPGGPGMESRVEIENPNPDAIEVVSLTAGEAVVGHPDCPVDAVISPDGNLLPDPVRIPGGESVSVVVAGVSLSATAPVGCAGVELSLPLAADSIRAQKTS